MSEQLTVMLDNVSRHTSQLTAQITQCEIEGDLEEERETEFGDCDFVYGFWVAFMN